ncbi:MAG TPA: hypothetical protein GXX38_03775 [Clostridia bacterium]|nr:hypothetical protein [Clostridia bacterium]
MKKFLAAVMIFIILISNGIAYGSNSPKIEIELDGVQADFENYPVLKEGRVLVPVRSIFSRLNAEMNWKEESREAILIKDGTEIVLGIDKKQAKINGVDFNLDVPAQIFDGYTYVPLRFITQAFGYEVEWDQENYLVSIVTKSIARPEVEIYGYYGFGSYNSLLSNPEKLSKIAPMWFVLDGDGSIKTNYPQDYQDALAFCRKNGIKIDAVLFQNNSSQLEQLLSSPDKWDKVCAELSAIMDKDDFDGVNLDLEGIPNAQRENFLNFVAYLRQFVKGKGKSFSLSLPPKTSDSQSWYVAYDYNSLKNYGDYFIVMAYDQHYAGGQPGPIAGVRWVEQVVKYGAEKLGANRLILACGLYGYDWPEGQKAKVIDYVGVQQLVNKYAVSPSWSQENYSPYLVYTDEQGIKHSVWFENEKSIGAKLVLVDKYELKGVALWRLGLIAEPVWKSITTKFTPRKTNF